MPTCKYKHLSRFVNYAVYIYVLAQYAFKSWILLMQCSKFQIKLSNLHLKKKKTTLPLENYSFSHDQFYHLAGQHFLIL